MRADARALAALVCAASSTVGCGLLNATTGLEPPITLLPDFSGSVPCGEDAADLTLTTDDGEELGADFFGNGSNRDAVILVHESPLSQADRFLWDADSFIRPLLVEAHGLAVLRIDRRGVAEGNGDADGPGGLLDVAAAHDFLVGNCAFADERIALVGASSGSTSIFDFVVDERAEPPAAVAFLSAGDYTGQNHEGADAVARFTDNAAALAPVKTLFLFGQGDTADVVDWHLGVQGIGVSGEWEFAGQDGVVEHGTDLLDVSDLASFMASFIAEHIGGE